MEGSERVIGVIKVYPQGTGRLVGVDSEVGGSGGVIFRILRGDGPESRLDITEGG